MTDDKYAIATELLRKGVEEILRADGWDKRINQLAKRVTDLEMQLMPIGPKPAPVTSDVDRRIMRQAMRQAQMDHIQRAAQVDDLRAQVTEWERKWSEMFPVGTATVHEILSDRFSIPTEEVDDLRHDLANKRGELREWKATVDRLREEYSALETKARLYKTALFRRGASLKEIEEGRDGED